MSEYTELLARLDREAKDSVGYYGMPICRDAAAAIRDLTAKLEAERKAREAMSVALNVANGLALERKQRAEAAERGLQETHDAWTAETERRIQAESRFAQVFERTRERAAKAVEDEALIDNTGEKDDIGYNLAIEHSARAIRSLQPEGEESVAAQTWCEHVGGLGPPFPYCKICADRSAAADLIPGLERAAEITGRWKAGSMITIVDSIVDAIRAEIEQAAK